MPADTAPDAGGVAATRRERLLRWAALLEREPRRRFEPSPPFGGLQAAEWHRPSPPGSPLDVASGDPVLRIAGLCGSAPAVAADFFGLSTAELDRILGRRSRPDEHDGTRVAWRIRNVADPSLQNMLTGLGVTAAIAIAALVVALGWASGRHR